jgi:hypothetical protein
MGMLVRHRRSAVVLPIFLQQAVGVFALKGLQQAVGVFAFKGLSGGRRIPSPLSGKSPRTPILPR